ncbi:bifunctional hydroxymethylpyrimidine kinase/phosphomethylpyrimidine kinase [Halovenus marina]|uniref:bifunctional hydroxymethylpyrimidine kinase/phosphomethylpyrimidine kinase n=1 Tax=Halovenus marina TaxID=3396621 RepID=UPI003F54B844
MTRREAPVSPPVVLTIAGSDSGGGAGIQADLKTIEAGGAFGTSAITSATAQHTQGVESTHVLPIDEVEAQCQAVLGDFDVAAVKTGMLATTEVVELVTETLREADLPAVVDPVMVAASGDRLLDPDAEAAYEDLATEATLVTPNADEAEVLTGIDVTDTEQAQRAGEALVEMGVDGALVKGGHVPGEDVVDVLVTDDVVETVRHPRVETDATHGSGCTLSAAIATRLAYGDDLPVAVRAGIDLLARAVRYHLDVGEGPGAVHHMVAVRDRAERQPTAERVRDIVDEFVERDISRLVPDVGTNVVGATPYAEVPGECAAVDGHLHRTQDGVRACGDVRFGGSDRVARTLLAAREVDADCRFAVNCRLDADIELALERLEWPLVEYDQPADEGRIDQTVTGALTESGSAPVALVGRDDARSSLTLVAPDAAMLVERTATLLDIVEG